VTGNSGYYTVAIDGNLIQGCYLLLLEFGHNSQSTDVPTGQGFATSLKMDCTTADASPSFW
jgi:hypothetical protein